MACPPGTRGSRAEKGFTLLSDSQVPMSMRSFSDLFPLLEESESQNINPQEVSSLTRIPLTGAGWLAFSSVPVVSPEPLAGGRKESGPGSGGSTEFRG